MAKDELIVVSDKEPQHEVDKLKQRMDMLDERLDNIDSLVTAVAERIVKQPITICITCPGCGKKIEISLVGTQKPT